MSESTYDKKSNLYKSTRTGRYFLILEGTDLSGNVSGLCLTTLTPKNLTGTANDGQLQLIAKNWRVTN